MSYVLCVLPPPTSQSDSYILGRVVWLWVFFEVPTKHSPGLQEDGVAIEFYEIKLGIRFCP